MITVYPVLRQRMREHKVSCRSLAVIAGVDIVSFYLKMCGIRRWNLPEVVRICCFFRTPDAEHLFVRKHFKSQFL
jgi:hypothetical protein